MPTSVADAWTAYCEDLGALEACVGCSPAVCAEHADGFEESTPEQCKPSRIALFRCIAMLARTTAVDDCYCDSGDLECDYDPTPCDDELAASNECLDGGA